jgi:hypothetical protein
MRAMLPFVALLGCTAPPPPMASLPADSVTGVGDLTRAAILGSAYAFSAPESLAGRPDAAARAAAQVEFLATEIPFGFRWTQFSPTIGHDLALARDELRGALAIAPAAEPQAVVDGLYGAARALGSGDRAAAAAQLKPPAFTAPETTLARLADLPALPRTRTATALTERELNRVDQDGRFNAGGGGDKP